MKEIWRLSYKDHITNDEVRNRVRETINAFDLLQAVRSRKLRYVIEHVTRKPELAKTIQQRTVPDGRR